MIKNNLIVIEKGMLTEYPLDDRLCWHLGRPSKDNFPEIRMHTETISRRHGRFQNIGGFWCYYDGGGKNGTIYNNKKMEKGLNGKIKPVMLEDGDVFIFGGGEKPVINSQTVWALFIRHEISGGWRRENTEGREEIYITDGSESVYLNRPEKGSVVEKDSGIAIYMGASTYLCGNLELSF